MSRKITAVDWDAVFERELARASFSAEGAAHWDKLASHMCGGGKQNRFTAETLKRLDIRPHDTVLDLGAGNGGLAIPLARRAAQVTALDISPRMLSLLQQNARDNGVANIVTLERNWQHADIGSDVPVHDVVVASRCLPLGNLRRSVEKMIQAARRACYTVWRISSGDDFLAEACRAMGREYHPFPSYSIFYGLLCDMGVHADIQIYATAVQHRHASLEDAIGFHVRGAPISEKERARLKAHLEGTLQQVDGVYQWESSMRWALVWWQKEEQKEKKLAV